MMNCLRGVTLIIVSGLAAGTAHAQPLARAGVAFDAGTPAAAPAAQERAASGSFLDSAQRWAKDHQILERLSGEVDGWYPRFGGLTRGSGFGLGPGYRLHPFGSPVLVDASAAISIRAYKAVDVRARWAQLWQDRVELWTDYRYEDFPQEDFYGVGVGSLRSTRTSYTYRSHDISLRAQVKPQPWLRTGLKLGYLNPTIRSGRDNDFPSIEELFTDATVPGLATQPNFLHTELFAEADSRDTAGNPKQGGFYRAAFSAWDGRTDGYDFHRVDGEASHYVPLTADRKHVMSGRAGISAAYSGDGNVVPFYFYPYIGSQDTVRSLRDFRFRDETAVWFGPEYRWIPIKWISTSAFADFGKIGHGWDDLTSHDLKRGYGFGFHVHSDKQSFFHLEYAFGGGEGRRIFVRAGF